MSQGKSKRQKKKRRDRQRVLHKSLRQRVKKNLPHHKVIMGPASDGVNMSEVLEEFVEPYRKFAETKEAYQKLLTTAIIAWNVTLFSEKDRPSRLDELVLTLPEDVREDGRQIIEELMVRKERFFSQHRRMIIDFEVADTGRQWHLSVMSTVGPASRETKVLRRK